MSMHGATLSDLTRKPDMRLTASFLVLLMSLAGALPAWAATGAAASPSERGQSGSRPQAASERPREQEKKPAAQLPVSIDRIKRELEQPAEPLTPLKLGEIPLPVLNPNETEEGKAGATFRVRVEASRFELPPFMETLKQEFEPSPWGGIYHHEMMQMMTPPDYRGSAPFTNSEMVQVLATSFATAMALRAGSWALGEATDWLRLHREAEARRQVKEEVEDFKRKVGEDGKYTKPPKK